LILSARLEYYVNSAKFVEEINMNELRSLTEKIVKFRDERNWEQFHNSNI